MKKHFIFASLVSCYSLVQAQNELDALRYSTIGSGGTARTLGMAGAFSSIGADPSAVMVNPGGIGTFRRGEFNFGFQFQNTLNRSTYLGDELRESRLNFNMPNIHLVVANIKYDDKGRPRKKGLSAVNFGFNINRLAGFQGVMGFDARNQRSSVTDFLADHANFRSSSPGDLQIGTLETLAFDAGAIDYNDTFRRYVSRYRDSNRNNQQTGTVFDRGAIYEYQITGGLNFSNKVMVGLGLFYTSLRFSQDLSILETDFRPFGAGTRGPDLATLDYQYKFSDRGNGFGARFGIIARPTEQLRLGFAIHTPRTFTINSEYGYSIAATGDPGSLSAPPAQFNDPLNTYKYKVTTPARMNAGIGFVIGKIMILNADFDFYNYASARLSADDVVGFNRENNAIRRNFRNVTNVRIGAEFNIPNPEDKDQAYRLRAGFASLPSPYNPNLAGLDDLLKKGSTMLACGFGFRDKDYYMDFALTYQTASGYFNPYVTADALFPSSAITNSQGRTALSFTMGFNIN